MGTYKVNYTGQQIDEGIAKANSAVQPENVLNTLPKNAGSHNSIYRGKDITALFYNGTLSQQIAAGTFDDIFVGDYIIGQTSGKKYLVADIDYRLHTGDTELTTHHILMIPDRTMGAEQMNTSDTATGAYIGSQMYTTNLTAHKITIQNDFGSEHILSHRSYLSNAISNNYESARIWKDSTIELMNELMVYGSNIFHNIANGTNIPSNNTIDKSQLSIFRLDKSKIAVKNSSGNKDSYWLRDVVSSTKFAFISDNGLANSADATYPRGVRPAFLVY